MNEHDFSRHEVTFYQMMKIGDKPVGCEFLEFRERGTVFGKMQFHIVGRVLFVTGDYGDAVYTWPTSVLLEQIAGFGLEYFAEKCTASEVGIPFRQWYPNEARDFVIGWMDDCGDERDAFEEAFGDAEVNHPERFDSALDWSIFLGDHGADLFGDGWEEYVDVGYGVHLRCQLHHEGIVAAVGQLDAWKHKQGDDTANEVCNVCHGMSGSECPYCGEHGLGITTPFTSDGIQVPVLSLTMEDVEGAPFEKVEIHHVKDQEAVRKAHTVTLSYYGQRRVVKDRYGPLSFTCKRCGDPMPLYGELPVPDLCPRCNENVDESTGE